MNPRYTCAGCRRPLRVAGMCRSCTDAYVWLNDPWAPPTPGQHAAARRRERAWERRQMLEHGSVMLLVFALGLAGVHLLLTLAERVQ